MNKIVLLTIGTFFILQGCGNLDNSTDGERTDNTSSLSKAEAFVRFNYGDSMDHMGTIPWFSEEDDAPQIGLRVCQESGTRSIRKIDDLIYESTLNACIEKGMESTGKAKISITKDGSFSIQFIRDTTLTNLENDKKITYYKGSYLDNIRTYNKEESKLILNFKILFPDNVMYHSSHLTSYTTDNSEYLVSGEVYYQGESYIVDKAYTASRTPMRSDDDNNLLSGTEKYYNSKNEHITLKVTSKNTMEIALDKDNDGINDLNKTITLR